MRHIIIPLLAAALAAAANAQELKNEVVIQREVEPQERPVTRPSSVAPAVVAPAVARQQLSLSEYTGKGQVQRSLSMLEPAAYADSFAVSPYRGYATLAYFPAYNLEASAGYRFIDNAATTLGAWLQFDGTSYNMPAAALPASPLVAPAASKVRLSRNSFAIGAYGEQRFSPGSLGVDIDYRHGAVSLPMIADDFTQHVNSFGVDALWKASSTSLPWHLGAGIALFGYAKDAPAVGSDVTSVVPSALPRPSESVLSAKGGIALPRNSHSWSLDVDAAFQHLNTFNFILPQARLVEGVAVPAWDEQSINGINPGVVNIRPAYTLNKEKFSARIGLNFSLGTGADTGLDIYPDITLAWTPTQQASVWLRASGERVLNTLSSIYARNPYHLSTVCYSPSTFCDAVAGINLGPVKGFAFEGWVGYSSADQWAVSCLADYVPTFCYADLKALRYGVRASWQWRSLLKVALSAEGAGTGAPDKSYYLWDDNARWVLGADLTVSPVSRLDISVNWSLRTGRKSLALTPSIVDQALPFAYFAVADYDLSTVNDLDIEARYRVSPALSVFARVDNCLARRWFLAPAAMSQRLHGLVGVAFKF